MGKTSKDKLLPNDHYCKPPKVFKKAGDVWRCPKCGAVYTCRKMSGRLTWLLTRDGRK
jgi:ribosomal protein L37AE/L43A